MDLQPLGAIHEDHVGALGMGGLDAFEVGVYVVHGVVDVLCQHPAQLVHPPGSLVAVAAHEGVHGEDVHVVVVGQGGLLLHPVADAVVVDDVVGAYQTCQAEGLGGGVLGHRPHAGVLAHRLGGDVLIPRQDDVRPDLVRDHVDVVLTVQLHDRLDLPPLPDASRGVVGGAEQGGVDAVLYDLLFHIGKVQPPYALPIEDEGALHDSVARVGQRAREAHVDGAVEQDVVPFGAEGAEGGEDTAQHAVLVADVLLFQTHYAVAGGLPTDDGVEILLAGVEVAEAGVADALRHGSCHGGSGGEIHIGHPHGDGIKALLGGTGRPALSQGIHRQGILAAAVQNGGKIVFHGSFLSLVQYLPMGFF